MAETGSQSDEILTGLLHCSSDHWFPVVRGIPRMLADALAEHWPTVEDALRFPELAELRERVETSMQGRTAMRYDRRTGEAFSLEWEHHVPGDRTWGMDVDDRVRWFFSEPIHIPPDELQGMVMLDAGCGNGSQSVAYTELGLEVVALDLSAGLEHGQAFRHLRPTAHPDKVHFVQGDLLSPPFGEETFDLIHSAGVLQATPDTEATFRGVCRLLRPGGTFYVWVLKPEPIVTPVVNGLRAITTRLAPRTFARVAQAMAPPFQVFCRATNRLGIRSYPALNRREAALALMDIFGAPYAHCHTFDELADWYTTEGFDEFWPCNEGRRGIGICGRKRAEPPRPIAR